MTTVANTKLTVAAVAVWKKQSLQLVFIPLVLLLARTPPSAPRCFLRNMSLTRSLSCIFITRVVKKFPPLITSKPDFTPNHTTGDDRTTSSGEKLNNISLGMLWGRLRVVNCEYFPTPCLPSVNTPDENIFICFWEKFHNVTMITCETCWKRNFSSQTLWCVIINIARTLVC